MASNSKMCRKAGGEREECRGICVYQDEMKWKKGKRGKKNGCKKRRIEEKRNAAAISSPCACESRTAVMHPLRAPPIPNRSM